MRRWSFLLILTVALAGCGGTAAPAAQTQASPAPAAAAGELSAIKTYLTDKVAELKGNTGKLAAASNHYYELAKAANFDYVALWQSKSKEVSAPLTEAKAAWVAASPGYEQIEGIVAGVPSLADFDVILDAGSSGADGGDNVAPVDLTLADGRTLAKPGNLFGVTETTLWGTAPEWTVAGVQADLNGNGQVEFGESLPDANVLKAGAEALDRYTGELQTAAAAWQPTDADAFTALVVMIPTMDEYFGAWKNSRFVAGDASTQRDFVAISRLSDIQNILGSLQVVYASVKPKVTGLDPAQADQIEQELNDLKAYVADVYAKEQGGKQYTAEEADLLGTEAQNRATGVTGKISQVAAKLNIEIKQ